MPAPTTPAHHQFSSKQMHGLLAGTILVVGGLVLSSGVFAQTLEPSPAITEPLAVTQTLNPSTAPMPPTAVPTSATPQLISEPPATPKSNSLTLVAMPPRLGDDLSLTAKPGETVQENIKVKNNSDSPVRITSQAVDFILDEDGETPIPVDEATSSRWSLASWITVAPNSQVLAPNQTAQLSLVIEVPEDALPGGHYAMVLHQPTGVSADETATAGAQLDSATGVNQRVGTLVYFTVAGPINEEAYIRNFQMPFFSEFGPVPFSFTVENRSDIHIQPKLKMEIRNIFGKTVDSFGIESKNIFPLTERSFEGQWDHIWGFGPYKATVAMNFGAQGKVAMASTTFWLLPVKLILAVVIVILTLIAVGVSVRRHMIHRKTDQSKQIKELEDKVKELENQKS